MNSIMQNYKSAIAVLSKRPIILWGLTLLCNFLITLAGILGAIPIISLPITFAFEASLSMLYLKGLRGNAVDSKDLFTGFSNFKRIAGGMAWMYLWILLWGLIPIVGIVFAVIKTYSYRFTPYILMTRPEVHAMDAIKESMKMTKGIRGKMFWADAFLYIGYGVCSLILGLFAAIPYIGVLFGIILFVFVLLYLAVSQIFLGLVTASFYENACKAPAPNPNPGYGYQQYQQGQPYQQPYQQAQTYQQPYRPDNGMGGANNAPVNNAPTNNAPTNNAPVNNAPVNDAPVNNAPTNNAPDNGANNGAQ